MPPRGRHPINQLTDLMVRQARLGRHADGNGLYLVVRPNGRRCWMQRLVIQGRRRDLGLGAYPLVSLSAARAAALQNRLEARAGGDPAATRRKAAGPTIAGPSVPTFSGAAAPNERGAPGPTLREAVEQMIKTRSVNWKNASTGVACRRLFEKHAFALNGIAEKPVSQMTLSDVEEIINPIWKGRGSKGYVLRQYLAQVFAWAVAHGYRRDNPAADVKALLPRVKSNVDHHPSLPHQLIRKAMAAVAPAPGDEAVKLALLFTVLCASRIGEVTRARWEEFDLDVRKWTVPPQRMKSGKAHRVPLSVQAVELLERSRGLDRSKEFVFRSIDRRGRPREIGRTEVSRFLGRLGLVDERRRRVVTHGFRATFRVWAAEVGRVKFEVCEAALAHVQSNKTVAAYARTDLFKPRRRVMQKWADYVLPRVGADTAAPHSNPHPGADSEPTSQPT